MLHTADPFEMIFEKPLRAIFLVAIFLLPGLSCRKKDISGIEDVGALVNITGTWEGSWIKTLPEFTEGGQMTIYFQQNDTLLSGTMIMLNDPCYLTYMSFHGSIHMQHILFTVDEVNFLSEFSALSDQFGKKMGGNSFTPVDCQGFNDVQGTFNLEKKGV